MKVLELNLLSLELALEGGYTGLLAPQVITMVALMASWSLVDTDAVDVVGWIVLGCWMLVNPRNALLRRGRSWIFSVLGNRDLVSSCRRSYHRLELGLCSWVLRRLWGVLVPQRHRVVLLPARGMAPVL